MADLEILVSTRKGLFVVAGSGSRAHVDRVSFLGDRVDLALCDARDGSWYAALRHGHFGAKLHRSLDRGRTWSEIPIPEYPEKPEGLVERDFWGRDREWSTRGIWALEIAPDAPGALWCGTSPGGLFRSDDRGRRWRLLRSLWDHPSRARWVGGGEDDAMLHSILVDPRDPRRVLVGVSTGGLWQTRDGGATWQPRTRGMRANYVPPELSEWTEAQDPHHVVRCQGAPDVLWCQHHGGLYRSVDDAATWRALSAHPTSFGFAVAVHPRDPDTAWIVPAESDQRRTTVSGRVVVSRTRDGGGTWDVLTTGLPQVHAYDLILRHALDVAPDGRRLAMGSTTGHLWTTDDQGDHWHAVVASLPPIYAVRYAT
jgi:hypothetical protein